MSQYYDIDDIIAEEEVFFIYSLLDGLTSISSSQFALTYVFAIACSLSLPYSKWLQMELGSLILVMKQTR